MQRDPNERPETQDGQDERAPWVPPRIVCEGSLKHLVRGASNKKGDGKGNPGKKA